jgi:hypothetical protein
MGLTFDRSSLLYLREQPSGGSTSKPRQAVPILLSIKFVNHCAKEALDVREAKKPIDYWGHIIDFGA